MKKINLDTREAITSLIQNEFKGREENITPLKILALLGIAIENQTLQLTHKEHRLKIRNIIEELVAAGLLRKKSQKHGTLGVKENAYTII